MASKFSPENSEKKPAGNPFPKRGQIKANIMKEFISFFMTKNDDESEKKNEKTAVMPIRSFGKADK